MIHSLAGGEIRELLYADFAKVEVIEDGIFKGNKLWYICEIKDAKVGDFVLAPIGVSNRLYKAKIERIDRQVNSQVSPVPFKKAKRIQKLK